VNGPRPDRKALRLHSSIARDISVLISQKKHTAPITGRCSWRESVRPPMAELVADTVDSIEVTEDK